MKTYVCMSHHSWHIRHHITNLFTKTAQFIEIRAGNLDGDGTADARKHFIHPMGDEPTDVGGHTRQREKSLTDPRDGSRAISHGLTTQFKIHMGDVHARTIGISWGAPGAHLNPADIVAGLETF